jgi:hypothetical protein
MNFTKRMTLTGLVCLSLAGSPAMAQTVNVPFDSDQWIIKDDNARVEEHMGRQCLFLEAGEAWLRDVDMRDGVIEVDIAPRGGVFVEGTSDDGEEPLFTGVIFRVQPYSTVCVLFSDVGEPLCIPAPAHVDGINSLSQPVLLPGHIVN